MSPFKVKRGDRVLLETDDWVAAERKRLDSRAGVGDYGPTIVGTHPTHDFRVGTCGRCGAWNNGSYGSRMPCGYDRSVTLLEALAREEAARR